MIIRWKNSRFQAENIQFTATMYVTNVMIQNVDRTHMSWNTEIKCNSFIFFTRSTGNEYESLLKQFSIQYMDLSPNMQKDLDEYAQFQRRLGLYAMDLVFLSEFYCIRTEKNIDKKTAISRIKYKTEQIEEELVTINKDLNDVKK